MNSFKIIGLNVNSVYGNSYETVSQNSDNILHDCYGKGIVKDHLFIEYTLFIECENVYYGIYLSESHSASFGGKLCTLGNIRQKQLNISEVMSNITHEPLSTLSIKVPEENEFYEDNISVCLNNDPNTCVFKFSYDGGNEKTPSGYIYVNINLFKQIN